MSTKKKPQQKEERFGSVLIWWFFVSIVFFCALFILASGFETYAVTARSCNQPSERLNLLTANTVKPDSPTKPENGYFVEILPRFLLRHSVNEPHTMFCAGNNRDLLCSGKDCCSDSKISPCQRKRKVGLIDNINLYRKGEWLPQFPAPVLQGYPLNRLQLDAFLGCFSGTGSLSRLPSYSEQCEDSHEYQPPFGPFEGCVPVWRLVLSALFVVAGARIVWKGKGQLSLWIGGGCVSLSAIVALTGHAPCKGGKNQERGTRHVTVLHIAPVTSAVEAVRAAIVQEFRSRGTAEES